MRALTFIVMASALSLVTVVTSFAQTSPRVGNGTISGRIVAADGSRPLAGAEVRLTGLNANETRALATDEQGRYAFTGLGAGRYSLRAEKGGYLPLGYGQRSISGSSRALDLGAGQSRDGVDIVLSRGAVITVRVTDEFGNPRAGVEVNALQYRGAGGSRRLTGVTGASRLSAILFPRVWETDDRGEIRMYDLPAGDYWLRARLYESDLMDTPESTSDRQLIYPPIYYPGTPSAGEAQPVSVAAGQEMSVGITLVPARAAHISGRAIAADGKPGRGYVVLKQASDGISTLFRQDLVNGAFTFSDIRPGDYVIEKLIEDPPLTNDEHGSVSVTVAGENISDLVITTSKPGTLRGQVLFDTGAPPAGMSAEEFSVSASVAAQGLYANADLSSDWRFTLEGITVPAHVEPSGWWDGWVLKEMRLGGADVTGTSLREASDLQVVLTKGASVTGTVADEAGALVIGGAVLMFPEGPADPTSEARFVAVTNNQGRFTISDLPPGRYLAVAIDSVDEVGSLGVDARVRLSPRASRVTLGAGESTTLRLMVTTF